MKFAKYLMLTVGLAILSSTMFAPKAEAQYHRHHRHFRHHHHRGYYR